LGIGLNDDAVVSSPGEWRPMPPLQVAKRGLAGFDGKGQSPEAESLPTAYPCDPPIPQCTEEEAVPESPPRLPREVELSAEGTREREKEGEASLTGGSNPCRLFCPRVEVVNAAIVFVHDVNPAVREGRPTDRLFPLCVACPIVIIVPRIVFLCTRE